MISFITTGRDDDFGNDFLNRLYLSISKNIEVIEKFDRAYEYVLVEWCPIKNYLIYNKQFKDLFDAKNIVDVIVKPEVALKENLNPRLFYEYFAKNAGIRMSKYDMLVILNSDIVLPEKTMKMIVGMAEINFNKRHYYRPLNRVQVDNNLDMIKRECVHRPKHPDAVVCGYYSGDILIVARDVLIECGQGYDETNQQHRTLSQSKMDGEILWNLYRKGITLQFLDADYWHINHGKLRSSARESVYNMGGYVNKSNWGFIDYPKKVVSEKLIEIG